MKKLWLCLVAGLSVLPLFAGAYQSPGQPSGYVNDYAGMLGAAERTNLESTLAAYTASTTNEIAVVTVTSLGGDTVENFANELFQEWGIGKKGTDNGVLLLIAKDDRELRIEVGYGLEPVLTDAQSKQIIERIITPAFKDGDFDSGIVSGVNAIMAALSGEDLGLSPSESSSNLGRLFNPQLLIFILIGVMWLVSAMARSKSWWAGGVVGALAGSAIWAWWSANLFWIIGLALFGLMFDYIISKTYRASKSAGVKPPWWAGGGGFGGSGGGGGFGGFSGGSSGGGGASGRW